MCGWRGSLLALCVALWGGGAVAEDILGAEYLRPVSRYHHDILGHTPEWGAMRLRLDHGKEVTITLPDSQIFEDIAPRLADLDGDGAPEVMAVQTDLRLGARFSVWDETGLIVATPFIGQARRWLAPVGVADLDGDGAVEIAYVDRPHLAKLLRVWRFVDGQLVPVADQPFLTNHRIGWDHIPGGIRACAGQPPVIITANGDWTQVMATTLADGRLSSVAVGPYRGDQSLSEALTCR